MTSLFSGYYKRFSYSISHYDITLVLNPRLRKIQAEASVVLSPLQRTKEICFLLADKCSVDRIDFLGIALPYKSKPARPGLNLISAVLPLLAETKEKLVVNVIYSWEEPTWDSSLNLPPDTHWYPFSPAPQRYTCALDVVFSDSVRVLGPGEFMGTKPVGTKVSHRWVSETPFWGIHLLAGEFLRTTRETQPPLEIDYPRKLLNQAKAVADSCEELMGLFGENLGPAPFPRVTVALTDDAEPHVRSSFYITCISNGTLEQIKEEHPGRERYMYQYKLLAQCLAHHWLKSNLTVPHPRERWCLEALAEYCSWLAIEEKYGKARREKIMAQARERILAAPRMSLQKGADIVDGELPQWVTDKGSWIMRMCHCLAGEKFLPSIQENIALCQGDSPGAAEFFLSLGKTAGTDLSQFYKSWCLSPSQLNIGITGVDKFQKEDGGWQLSFILVNNGRLKWPHPVEVEIELADGSKEKHSLLIQAEPHTFHTDSPAQSLTVDPDMCLLNWADKKKYFI
ncbi:MAG TPA: hypothetical protein PKV05_07915 [Bacillota bacterium]|nr:hypothetical protein [Bacillota bacterium]